MPQEELSILVSMIAGSLAFIFLLIMMAVIIKRNYDNKVKHKTQLFEIMLQAQEKERKRIAKDIHDGLGGLLGGATIRLIEFMDQTNLKEEQLGDIAIIKALVDKASEEARNSIRALTPAKLSQHGFNGALMDLCEDYRQYFDVEYSYNFKREVPEIIAIQLYRMLQELLHNTFKHAQATKVNLKFTDIDKCMKIIYTDNGIGFNESTLTNSGSGIKNIKDRINYLEGEMKSSQNNGSVFEFLIPVLTE